MTTRTTDLTIGDLRALIRYEGPEDTPLADALAQIAAADEAAEAHQLDVRAFDAYRLRRDQRQADALEKAAQHANDITRGGDGEKMAARRQARTDAYHDFQAREPALDFNTWVQLGRPETHTVNVTPLKRATTAVLDLVR
jgi:hypothetical protein